MAQHAGVARNFLLFILFTCTCVCDSVRACRDGYFEMFDTLGGHFGVFDSQHHFLAYFSSLLPVLALGPTVILRVYSCLDLRSRNRETATCVGLVKCFSSLFFLL